MAFAVGAQFTEKEGQQLIARAYNPRLSEEVNRRRVGALVGQIKEAAASKESAAQHFEKHGTLRGWEGKSYTVSDFESAIDGVGPEESKTSPNKPSNFSEDENGVLIWNGGP